MNNTFLIMLLMLAVLSACSSSEKQTETSPKDSLPAHPVAQDDNARIADSMAATDTIAVDTPV
ncbi:MAG: hypothetical protein AAF570_11015, partial [Bacteroidota bacterium]